MPQSAGIEVDGLRDFLRGLKKVQPELDKALKAELKVVAEVVAEDVRSTVPSKSGRARGSVRAGADARGPYIVGGKKAVPYFGWLDFGSRKAVLGNPRSVGPWARSGAGPKDGRFFYPGIRRNEDTVQAGARQALTNALEASGV